MGIVFERFTEAARRVVVSAQTEAVALDHHYIGTEHILLGILNDDSGAGCRLLQLFEVPIDWVRQRVVEIIGRGGSAPSGHIPFTPRAKKVLELALREALRLHDNFIGSEHILLGLFREGEGVAVQILAERGVTRAGIEARLGDVEREPALEPEPGGAAGTAGQAVAEEEMIHVPGEHFARLVAEVARLRELLRHHGIDPDEPLPPEPGFGDDGEPPVA